MKKSDNYRKMCVLAMAVSLLSPCIAAYAAALAANSEPNATAAKLEVLTTLEQRMQKRISVDFRDTPIDDVIRIMAEQADVDVVKSPKVTGAVTAKLTNVPLEEALRNILAANGYDYVMSKSMIRVAPSAEITQESEKLVNKIYRITYADIKEVEKALNKFISQRGSISTNPGTSNIIVTDTESKIKAVDTFIEEIDRITPQILVEARIYDITCSDKLDLGVEWMAGRNTTYTDATGTATIPPGTLGANASGDTKPFSTGIFTGATGKTAGTSGLLKFGWLKDNLDIDVVIRAQQNLVNAKLLANPRILVLDNETAQIQITSEIPYQELTETSGGGSIGSTNFKDVGVTLNVKPHLTRDEKIRLYVEPEFSVKTGDVTFSQSGGFEYPVPIVDKRKAKTTLLIDNGQTIVLGGMRKKDVTKAINKVPLLGDIPILGYLFRFEGESVINSELVVFITPRLVEEPGLSNLEKEQYEVTNFPGPKPDWTRAEKKDRAGK
jgi:type IV pilus assembly protein PilQ